MDARASNDSRNLSFRRTTSQNGVVHTQGSLVVKRVDLDGGMAGLKTASSLLFSQQRLLLLGERATGKCKVTR